MYYADNHCTYVEQYSPEHTYSYTGIEMNSGKEMTVTVKAPDVFKYRLGEYIQVAFPYLSPEEREFLLSGMVFLSE